MADGNGFVQSVFDGSYDFYKKSLKQFDWYKKIYGTKCQVQRIVEDSKYNQVLGTIYSNNLKGSAEVETFNYCIIINMNRMVKVYNESSDTLDFYDNNSILKLGDVLVFTRRSREFRFKVTDVMTFSEVGGVLNQYTITPYIVVDTEESQAALERPDYDSIRVRDNYIVDEKLLQDKSLLIGSDEVPSKIECDKGYYGLGTVDISIDHEVINPGNIKEGVSILGIEGILSDKGLSVDIVGDIMLLSGPNIRISNNILVIDD